VFEGAADPARSDEHGRRDAGEVCVLPFQFPHARYQTELSQLLALLAGFAAGPCPLGVTAAADYTEATSGELRFTRPNAPANGAEIAAAASRSRGDSGPICALWDGPAGRESRLASSAMPIYEFRCANCGETFEELVPAEGTTLACPACGSVDSERVLSNVSPPGRLPRGAKVRDSESRRREREAARRDRISEAQKARRGGGS
jgi:putative FmdB family regulatory protein